MKKVKAGPQLVVRQHQLHNLHAMARSSRLEKQPILTDFRMPLLVPVLLNCWKLLFISLSRAWFQSSGPPRGREDEKRVEEKNAIVGNLKC